MINHWDTFVMAPKPETFEAWCCETIIASFPLEDVAEVYTYTLAYIGWLSELPCAV